MLTSIEFVCTASPASTTLPIMNSFSHSVIIKNAKVFPITGLRVHLFSFKMRQKHSNTFMFGRDIINSFKSNLEKRNIATFFGWRVQDTWPPLKKWYWKSNRFGETFHYLKSIKDRDDWDLLLIESWPRNERCIISVYKSTDIPANLHSSFS